MVVVRVSMASSMAARINRRAVAVVVRVACAAVAAIARRRRIRRAAGLAVARAVRSSGDSRSTIARTMPTARRAVVVRRYAVTVTVIMALIMTVIMTIAAFAVTVAAAGTIVAVPVAIATGYCRAGAAIAPKACGTLPGQSSRGGWRGQWDLRKAVCRGLCRAASGCGCLPRPAWRRGDSGQGKSLVPKIEGWHGSLGMRRGCGRRERSAHVGQVESVGRLLCRRLKEGSEREGEKGHEKEALGVSKQR